MKSCLPAVSRWSRLLLPVAVLGLSACAHHGLERDIDGAERARLLELENQSLRERVAQQQVTLEQSAREIQSTKTTTTNSTTSVQQSSAITQSAGVSMNALEGLPIHAKAGECYARVSVPAQFETRTERKLASEASERIELIPARYEWTEERVLVRPERERVQEVIPAKYRWVEERVLIKPETKRLIEVPARYEWAEERVLVKPASQMWKSGHGAIEKIDNQTGEIMCLVEVPAEYKTVRRKTLAAAATTRTEIIPAEYKTVRRQELVSEAKVNKIVEPAVYETVRVQKLVAPAREVRHAVPASYQEVEKVVKVADGRMDWRSVLCETNTTKDIVIRIQTALQGKGYTPGLIDGKLGRKTLSAVRAFQADNNLATGGVTMETVRQLGIRL